MYILLDLNYTLVVNNQKDNSDFAEQIKRHEYCEQLVQLLQEHNVILITARPEKYKELTLRDIQSKCNLPLIDSYFNSLGLPPHELKPKLVVEKIFPKYGADPSNYLAIESNPRTIKAYQKLGICCLTRVPQKTANTESEQMLLFDS